MFKNVHGLLEFPPGILNTWQALTDHFCFINHSPTLTGIIIVSFPVQSLHDLLTSYTCI